LFRESQISPTATRAQQQGEVKFTETAEQYFSTVTFRIANAIDRIPRTVYELDDLNRTPIDGQFYQQGLAPVRVTRRAVYKIDKILDKRVLRVIVEHLVR